VAYSWEPRWERLVIESHGIIIQTCRDRITKMFACPICIHALSKCLGGSKPSDYAEKHVFFFTAEDLITHIRDYHAMRVLLKKLIKEEGEEDSAG